MKTIPIHEAKTHLSRLIQQALDGEEIIISKRNEPLVRLEVIRQKPRARRFGGLKSLVLSMGPSFDEPLEDFADYAPPTLPHLAERPSCPLRDGCHTALAPSGSVRPPLDRPSPL